jgi:predicted TPR repeat methyltransferase
MSDTIESLFSKAHQHQREKQWPEAIACFTRVLDLSPDNAEAHHHLANMYAMQVNYRQALQHYREAVHAKPDDVATHYHLGLLLLKHHELGAAEKQFRNVLVLYPEHIESRFYLGVLQLNANQLELAAEAFERVLSLQDNHTDALTNLGVIALKREQGQRAVDYFTKALVFDSGHVEARNNLAATFMHHDRFENALMHYGVLLDTDPNNIEYLYNSGVAQMTLGHLPEAIAHFESILKQNGHHFAALNNLAAIQMRLGHRTDAIALLKRAKTANPADAATPFMLNALTGDEKQPEASPEYVRHLFNNYALYYDQHMQNTLKYTLPHYMMRTLHALGYFDFKRTLDIGCGTGLSGDVLRESSEHLTGIDIATKMIAQARAKDIYDQLIESELTAFLNQDTAHYDLITALDVLPYLGDLEPLFQRIKCRLTETGLFVFSCEISADEAWGLQSNARFCHHPDYIQALCTAHHLELIEQKKIIARQQEQRDVSVMLYIAKNRPKK